MTLEKELEHLREDLLKDDQRVFDQVNEFHKNLKKYFSKVLENYEKEYDITRTPPPETCLFLPEEKLNISVEKFLISNSITMTQSRYLREHIPKDQGRDAWKNFGGYFKTGQVDLNQDQESHWATKFSGIGNQGYHEPLGKYFWDSDSIAINTLAGFDIDKKHVPLVLLPLFYYISNRSHQNARSTFVHEMTHAYIYKKSNYSRSNRQIQAIDEAAAQVVNNLFGRDTPPPESYYEAEDALDPEIMQAARQAFLKSTENLDHSDSVSKVREQAVKAINEVEKGEDPVSALRENKDFESKMIRVASHARKKTLEEIYDDLASLGLVSMVGDYDVASSYLASVNALSRDSDFGIVLLRREIKDELVDPTKNVLELSKKPKKILEGDYWPDKWDESHQEALKEIFSDVNWTDPKAFHSGEIQKYLVFTMGTYLDLIEMALRRAKKLQALSNEIEKESEKLFPRYDNSDFKKDMKKIHENAQTLEKDTEAIISRLNIAEETVETSITRLKELDSNK